MKSNIYMNLLTNWGKSDKNARLGESLSPFHDRFNKFNNTRSRMLDSIYHMYVTFYCVLSLSHAVSRVWRGT